MKRKSLLISAFCMATISYYCCAMNAQDTQKRSWADVVRGGPSKEKAPRCAGCDQLAGEAHDGRLCDLIMLSAMVEEIRTTGNITDVVDIRILHGFVPK